MFNAGIENGNIYQYDYNNKTLVGVTTETFNEVKNGLDKALTRNDELAKEKEEYYNLLIEHGIIAKPKSVEELVKETQDQQTKIMSTLEDVTNVLQRLSSRMEVVENELTKPNSNGK